MTRTLQGIMKREIPFEEWHGKRDWVETCPQCGGRAEVLGETPRNTWGTGLGSHDTIDEILQIGGACGHDWGM